MPLIAGPKTSSHVLRYASGRRKMPFSIPLSRNTSSMTKDQAPSDKPQQDAEHLASSSASSSSTLAQKKKSIIELDAELQQKMQELAGDGGEAGVELEDGKPVAMKRSVRENMFRYI